MSKLVYDLGRDFLINMLSYPSAFRSVPYDPSFGVRGITLDINHGTLLKLDYNDRVTPNCAFRGRTRLSSTDVAKLYGGMHVSRSYRELNMKAMVDMFAMRRCVKAVGYMMLYCIITRVHCVLLPGLSGGELDSALHGPADRIQQPCRGRGVHRCFLKAHP